MRHFARQNNTLSQSTSWIGFVSIICIEEMSKWILNMTIPVSSVFVCRFFRYFGAFVAIISILTRSHSLLFLPIFFALAESEITHTLQPLQNTTENEARETHTHKMHTENGDFFFELKRKEKNRKQRHKDTEPMIQNGECILFCVSHWHNKAAHISQWTPNVFNLEYEYFNQNFKKKKHTQKTKLWTNVNREKERGRETESEKEQTEAKRRQNELQKKR